MPRLHPYGFLLLSALPLSALAAPTTLDADGVTPAYTLIEGVLGTGNVEAPDCSHPDFGPHITQTDDATLAAPVFVFHLHVTPDDDRCLYTDRQRTEIKVSDTSPAGLRINRGDTVFYRWRFRLDAGFQVSTAFTHLHQVRPYDGDTDLPIVMLTARRKDGSDRIELNHIDSQERTTVLASTALAPLRGEWVEAETRMTSGTHGQYMLRLTRVGDGAVLFDYSHPDLELWRNGSTFIRPKWGIYRSLQSPSALRDEQVRYARFCLARDSDECRPATEAASPVFTPAGGNYDAAQSVTLASTTPGVTLRFSSDGSFPTCTSGTVYTGPIVVASATTLHAIACRNGLAPSALSSAAYHFAAVPISVPKSAASASSNSGSAGYTVDGRLWTHWGARGEGQWIQYDLGRQRDLTGVDIAWYKGGSRQYHFELQGSMDGVTFTTLLDSESSGRTSTREAYVLGGARLRWLRIVGHGNSVDDTIAIAETVIRGMP